jgi:AcrR family transcriptional regulator
MGDTALGLRERKKARTREALQETALDLFGRQGFDHTTIEEIAEACEVSPRTFFRYFPTKEDVLFADSSTRREVLLSGISARPEHESAFVALREGMRALARDYEHDRVALALRAAIMGASPQLQLYKAEHQNAWESDVVDVLERRQHTRSARARNELQLVTAMGTAAMRVALDVWLADERGPGLVALLDRVFARLAAGFDPDAT